jgi:signal peptidase I
LSRSPLGRLAREVAETLVIALVLTFFIRAFVVESYLIREHSMEPTLFHGERVLVTKISYRFAEPKAGDIVVFAHPEEEVDLVKRVVGLPGQTVEVVSGRLYVDGEPVDEPYVRRPGSGDAASMTVPEEYLFVMGDNRVNSKDSRYFGPVPRANVKGRAWLVYWPPSRAQVLGSGD